MHVYHEPVLARQSFGTCKKPPHAGSLFYTLVRYITHSHRHQGKIEKFCSSQLNVAGKACGGMRVGALSHRLEEANIAGRCALQIVNEPKQDWAVVAPAIHIGDVDGIGASCQSCVLRKQPDNCRPAGQT